MNKLTETGNNKASRGRAFNPLHTEISIQERKVLFFFVIFSSVIFKSVSLWNRKQKKKAGGEILLKNARSHKLSFFIFFYFRKTDKETQKETVER